MCWIQYNTNSVKSSVIIVESLHDCHVWHFHFLRHDLCTHFGSRANLKKHYVYQMDLTMDNRIHLLLSQLYSPWWALASFTISRHVFHSCTFFFHLPVLIHLRPPFTSWSHLFLGLPLLWTPKISRFNKHFGVLSLFIRSMAQPTKPKGFCVSHYALSLE
jgi:hypothetical protein